MQLLEGLQRSFAGTLGAIVVAMIAGAGLASYLRENRLLAALLLLPGLLSIGTMVLLHRHLYPRFMFAVFPFAVMVVVRGAAVLGRAGACLLAGGRLNHCIAKRAGVLAAVGIIVVSALSLPQCYRQPKQDYLGALAYVHAKRQAGEAVVATGMAAVCLHRYYDPDVEVIDSAAQLKAIQARAPNQPIWLMYTFPQQLEAVHPDVWHTIQTTFGTGKAFAGTVAGGEVVVCRYEPSSESWPLNGRPGTPSPRRSERSRRPGTEAIRIH